MRVMLGGFYSCKWENSLYLSNFFNVYSIKSIKSMFPLQNLLHEFKSLIKQEQRDLCHSPGNIASL